MSAELTVTPGGPEDIDAAVDIYDRAGTARRGMHLPASVLEQTSTTLGAPQTWFFMCSDGPTPVGMAAAMPSREEEGVGALRPGVCHLWLLFVAPDRWNEGIGALLLDTVIADARGQGFSSIDLVTQDDNVRAHRLYSSRGFSRTGWSRPSRSGAGTSSEWARRL